MLENLPKAPWAGSMHLDLSSFSLVWTCASLLYTLAASAWQVSFGELEFTDKRIWRQILTTLALPNLAYLLRTTPGGLGVYTDFIYGVLCTVGFFSAYGTYNKLIVGPQPRATNMVGKVVIVTGGNSGIGYETAKRFVSQGALVFIACRDEGRAQEAIDKMVYELTRVEILARASDPKPKGEVRFLKMDLASLESVRRAALEFKEMKLPLDILVLNAGLMMGKRTLSADGYEMTFAVNHLGHFLLSQELVPLLEESKDGRVIVITSSFHLSPKGGLDFDDLQTEKDYTMFKAYSRSKLANVMFGRELHRRLQDQKKPSKTLVVIVHPGLVITNIPNNMPKIMRTMEQLIRPLLMLVQKQPEHGAYTPVFAATSSLLRKEDGTPTPALYLTDCMQKLCHEAAFDKDACKKLWTISEQLSSVKPKDQ